MQSRTLEIDRRALQAAGDFIIRHLYKPFELPNEQNILDAYSIALVLTRERPSLLTPAASTVLHPTMRTVGTVLSVSGGYVKVDFKGDTGIMDFPQSEVADSTAFTAAMKTLPGARSPMHCLDDMRKYINGQA